MLSSGSYYRSIAAINQYSAISNVSVRCCVAPQFYFFEIIQLLKALR